MKLTLSIVFVLSVVCVVYSNSENEIPDPAKGVQFKCEAFNENSKCPRGYITIQASDCAEALETFRKIPGCGEKECLSISCLGPPTTPPDYEPLIKKPL